MILHYAHLNLLVLDSANHWRLRFRITKAELVMLSACFPGPNAKMKECLGSILGSCTEAVPATHGNIGVIVIWGISCFGVLWESTEELTKIPMNEWPHYLEVIQEASM